MVLLITVTGKCTFTYFRPYFKMPEHVEEIVGPHAQGRRL